MSGSVAVSGRLVLADRVMAGRVIVEGDRIVAVEPDVAAADGPFIAPGFLDLHCHGFGGHDAMGGRQALDGMARALLRQGVTGFLPTAITLPVERLADFAAAVRAWLPEAPGDGASPLGGFNLEGPFVAPARKGAHNPAWLRAPADLTDEQLAPLLDGLRITTIAPELPGALELIARLRDLGIVTSIGHSGATLDEARAGYAAAGDRVTTTHLFNAMTGVDHREPGLSVVALTDDTAFTELIADGNHVHPALWPIIVRTKPADRLVLVSDALSFAGLGDLRAEIGGLEIEVKDGRCTLVHGGSLAGAVVALDTGVRNLVRSGVPLPRAVAAASANPAALLDLTDRGSIAAGMRADLVELDDDLVVRRVMQGGGWHTAA
ncbi:MAG: N-acetylglucosamine-6-phosphate deacetylase [Chloroflexota bacterium]